MGRSAWSVVNLRESPGSGTISAPSLKRYRQNHKVWRGSIR
jgi:hypothetical protein